MTETQSFSSAFSAVRESSFTPSTTLDDLPFEVVHTNVGDDFSATTGRFTCEIPGLYQFSYNIMTYGGAQAVQLVKNNVRINSVYRDTQDSFDMVSNAAVLHLAAGDQVWLQAVSSGLNVVSTNALFTSFSGISVEADFSL